MRRIISIILIGMLSYSTTASVVGCSRTGTPVTPAPKQDNDFSSYEAMAQRYEQWITLMEPFVTTNRDGTYFLDWEGFVASIKTDHPLVVQYFQGTGQVSDDVTVIQELKDGMPLANALLLKGEIEKSPSGVACWNYWWGRRCCFWGREAWIAISIFTVGGSVAGFNILSTGLALWAEYYYGTYGGFCLNQSWIGGVWLTRP